MVEVVAVTLVETVGVVAVVVVVVPVQQSNKGNTNNPMVSPLVSCPRVWVNPCRIQCSTAKYSRLFDMGLSL